MSAPLKNISEMKYTTILATVFWKDPDFDQSQYMVFGQRETWDGVIQLLLAPFDNERGRFLGGRFWHAVAEMESVSFYNRQTFQDIGINAVPVVS